MRNCKGRTDYRIISSITDVDGNVITYHYDSLSELTRVDDERINKRYTYTYDNGGNLTSVSEYVYTTGQLGNATATHTYSYDTVWKDKLLSYDGQRITYDAIGNPTSYMGAAMTWSNGRELSSIVDGNKSISYTYTNDGIRLSKTVNNITTSYVLDGSTILSETTGNETLNYYYDSTGDLQQIGYKKGTAAEVYYLAAHNGQGDVIAIYNASDSTLVGT
ncbi:MAG: hypothetical protein ACM3X1_06575, partial [Ignavibacteriales bacterium]